jgi:hypothetical protein
MMEFDTSRYKCKIRRLKVEDGPEGRQNLPAWREHRDVCPT